MGGVGSSPTCLIADDEQEIGKIFRALIKAPGFAVTSITERAIGGCMGLLILILVTVSVAGLRIWSEPVS